MMLLALALLQHPACGVERIAIKDLADRGRSAIHWTPESTTVAALRALPAPHPLPPTKRVAPVEMQVYRILAVIIGFKLEADQDYHIVVADPSNLAWTMIVEVPSPLCLNQPTDSLTALMAVRRAFEQRFHPTKAYKLLAQPVAVTLTGVGFFDKVHGQTGHAANGIELHPLTGVSFP